MAIAGDEREPDGAPAPHSVLPLRPGDGGEPVRDLQRRLGELGFDLDAEEGGRYGDHTVEAVRRFQSDRGLPEDGTCDDTTWAALVEAGYRLGDRFLYHRSPMVRGDDVLELQSQLGALGFDTGRADGIFGPDTARALGEFQRNSGLTPDGICGPDSVAALRRLAARRAGPTNVAQAREVDALRAAPRQLLDRRVVVGAPVALDAVADRLRRMLSDAGAVVAVAHGSGGSAQAREANEFRAELYLGLRLEAEARCRVSYYATEGFQSVGGRRLAEITVDQLGTVPAFADAGRQAAGMRLPVLRETRMTAAVCELGPAEVVVAQAGTVADALAASVVAWIERRLD